MPTATRIRPIARQGRQAAILTGGRLHLNEGPIDLVIGAEGTPTAVRTAHAKAADRFDGLLSELVAELPALRSPIGAAAPDLRGPVARRMGAAVRRHGSVFVTPMAAVAGAVADEILSVMAATPGLAKAYVNNGGDIAVHLAPDQRISIGAVTDIARGLPDGIVTLTGRDAARGIATSGAGGRSFSRGVADSVTVLAADAAAADVAATLIANAVDTEHPAVSRAPARSLDPDSDLGDRLVTTHVGGMPPEAVRDALRHGTAAAQTMLRNGLIVGALLCCRGQAASVGAPVSRAKPFITTS